MEEILEFCQRMLGVGEPAAEAAGEASGSKASDRVQLLAAASRACRRRAAPAELVAAGHGPGGEGLVAAVARELALATARLPERQREALALREGSRLSYTDVSQVMGIGVAAVAPLLARARLRLREELRGAVTSPSCGERDKALTALACRQDAEPQSPGAEQWLTEHLSECDACTQAHAAMLEASLRYRAWTVTETPRLNGSAPGDARR